MFDLPKSTEFNKRIPKQKFYENLKAPPALRRAFAEQIRLIYWRNKLAASTLNVLPGETAAEIEIFEIRLQTPQLDEAVLKQIDTVIPYHILFVLTCGGRVQAWIGYKETASSGSVSKVNRYYHTEWLAEDELRFEIDGLNMDAVYAGLMRQIAGDALQAAPGESLKNSVRRDERKKQLEKQIAALEKKMSREKQLNRQVEISAEIKKLKSELKAAETNGGKTDGQNEA